MSETALKFGPEWLRALSHGNSGNSVASPPLSPEPPKYKLADYRYGREEMLALFPKDPKLPDSLKEFHHLIKEKYQPPLALMPTTDEEQRIWATAVNSDLARGASGKGGSGPGVSISRTGRGGSVDRGRGRARGSYFPRGLSFEDGDDGPPGGFPRPRPMERSQSANEKDQRWDDRDRRYDRPYTGRNFDDSSSIAKQEGSRAPADNWRKPDKMDDDGSWRTAGVRGEKHGTRGSWRNHVDKDRNHEEFDKSLQRNHDPVPNGPTKNSQHKNQRHASSYWDDDISGNIPEWSMDEPSDTDIVGSFDSTGAFMETKPREDNADEIYASDEEEEKFIEGSPEIRPPERKKSPVKRPNTNGTELTETVGKVWATQPSPEASEEPPDTTHLRNETAKKVPTPEKSDKVTNSVIIPNIPQQQTSVTQLNDAVMLNVPDKSGLKNETNSKLIIQVPPPQTIEVPGHTEEDAFAHHKKATENMVAQWTEEEEHRIRAQSVDKTTILPQHHEDAYKWFYRDPQGEIQGPFASTEMLEWFQSGYFTMGLMVRRGCDELFSQLGHLMKTWGQVPFLPMVPAPPIRAPTMTTSPPTPMTQTTVPTPQPLTETAHQAKSDEQLRALQQQLLQQQLVQQQLIIRQAQLQQLFTQLKTQDTFISLNPHQQHEVLVRQFLAQHSLPRPGLGPMGDQASLLEQMPTLALPLVGLPMPSLLKNDLSLWGLSPSAGGTWPVGITNAQPPSGSIWDTEQPVMSTEAKILEEQKRIAEEERKKMEELRKMEEDKKREEERRKREEIERKLEEERLRQEYLKKEEERRLLEELKRQQEEQRRQEELKRIEEQKRKEEEERKLEEQRLQEELRQQEEKRRQAELEEKQKQEALRKKEEKRQLEEQKKLEEQKRQEELKRVAEQKKLEEQKRLEERKKLEELAKQEEIQHQKRLQKEKEQQRLQELEKQKELMKQKELEAKELKMQQERERQWELEKQRELEKLQLLQEQKLRAQGPVWGAQNPVIQNSDFSLADIQRLQEENEKEEREERLRQQQMLQHFAKQAQQSKNGPSWAKRSEVHGTTTTVLSLAEIQQEEATKLAQQQKIQKPKPVVSATTPLTSINPWGNSSHIINKVSAANWNYSDAATTGFWDDVVNNTSVRKSSRTNDSAFPALNNVVKPANASSNKSKNAKTKKDEENVIKLFESHRKATDEFTQWCTDALSNLPSSLDVPTFVAFLKDIESPYEVHDYVRSYLGESKEAREFGKLFLEKRSRYRNQAKQTPAEENMWGPAPAITPSVNKSVAQTTNDSDGHMSSKGKTKKKKNKMQKVDNSILGFTVQSNPDRINVGEIDHVDGM